MASRTARGFTIVELLIVIVVIAILAAITVVAYNGIKNRADFSKKQSDLSTIVKALELYKTDNGRYPNSEACDNQTGNYANGWCGWNQGSGESFIPGLSPKYMTVIPSLDTSLPSADTYLYKGSSVAWGANDGGGSYYQLMRYKSDGLASYETQGNSKIMPGYTTTAWGYRSDPVAMNGYDW